MLTDIIVSPFPRIACLLSALSLQTVRLGAAGAADLSAAERTELHEAIVGIWEYAPPLEGAEQAVYTQYEADGTGTMVMRLRLPSRGLERAAVVAFTWSLDFPGDQPEPQLQVHNEAFAALPPSSLESVNTTNSSDSGLVLSVSPFELKLQFPQRAAQTHRRVPEIPAAFRDLIERAALPPSNSNSTSNPQTQKE